MPLLGQTWVSFWKEPGFVSEGLHLKSYSQYFLFRLQEVSENTLG